MKKITKVATASVLLFTLANPLAVFAENRGGNVSETSSNKTTQDLTITSEEINGDIVFHVTAVRDTYEAIVYATINGNNYTYNLGNLKKGQVSKIVQPGVSINNNSASITKESKKEKSLPNTSVVRELVEKSILYSNELNGNVIEAKVVYKVYELIEKNPTLNEGTKYIPESKIKEGAIVKPEVLVKPEYKELLGGAIVEPAVQPELPKAEEPSAPAPKAEEPVTPVPKAEEPSAPTPKAEEPMTPAPKAEEPAAPAPKAEEPVVPEPKAEEPAVPAPKAEEPTASAPKVEEPTAPTPKAEEPAAPAPKEEEPVTPAPKAEEPVEPEPKAEEPTASVLKAEEPSAPAPKAEVPATPMPKAEEPSAPAPKAEEPTTPAPKAEEPSAPAPKAEEPTAPTPKAEEPTTPAPKVEEPAAPTPKAEEPAIPAPKAEEPATPTPKAEEPATSAPKAEEPAVPAPKTEEPAAPAPKAEEPATPTPKADEPTTPAPKVEDPMIPAPKAEEPAASTPKADEPTTPAPKAEEPAAPTPRAEEPAAPAPKAEEPAAPAPKAEEPATPAPKVEEPAVPAPKAEEPTTPAPKVEEPTAPTPKAEEPTTPAPKAEEPAAPTPKAEELAVPAPKAEEPVAPAPKAEEPAAPTPKAEEPAPKAEEPAALEPKAEEPAAPAPKAEEPSAPTPKVEEPAPAPKAEEPAAPAPKVEEPAVPVPKAEEPTTPAPKVEEPTAPTPKAEEPTTPAPKAEEPAAPTPKAEEPAVPEPKAEEPAAPTPKAEEPAVPEPKAEEPATPAPKAEEPATPTPKVEEPTTPAPKVEEPTAPTQKAEEPATPTPKTDTPSEEVAPKDEKLEEAKKDGKDVIEKIAASKLSEIEKVKDEAEKAKLEAKLKELKDAGLEAINNAKDHDAAVDATDEYQTKIDEINVPGEELPAPNYNKDNLTNGRNEGTTIDNGSTAIGHGSGEATATAPTQPASTSEGTASFRKAPEVQVRARRVARAANQPDGTVNISYNYDGMPDINGFLSDPGENNTVAIPNSATDDKVKELVKAKIQAKTQELAKHGYKVKEEIVFEQDTNVKNFNYVVTFTKEKTGTTGFRIAPEVQVRAKKVVKRDLSNKTKQINIYYNLTNLKDIAGALGEVGENNMLTLSGNATKEEIKKAIEEKTKSQIEKLNKQGFKVTSTTDLDQIVEGGDRYDYVVEFTKESKSTLANNTGFRKAPLVQKRAKRSVEGQETVDVNIYFNLKTLPGIAGALDVDGDTTIKLPRNATVEQVKTAIQTKIAKVEKRGYKVSDFYFGAKTDRGYDFVVEFKK